MKEEVTLVLATVDDAVLIHLMKYRAFMPLYEKYHDDGTTPVNEKIEKLIYQLTQSNSDYYLIRYRGRSVGAIRIARTHGGAEYRPDVLYISPLFILPEYQNRGIGQAAIRKVFELYPDTITWRLDTIKQELGNCHMYEKCGFVRMGSEYVINENMTLVDYERPSILSERMQV